MEEKLTESRKQVKQLFEKSKAFNEQIQKANKDLYRANIRLLSVGMDDLVGIVAPKGSKEKETHLPLVSGKTQDEDVIELDSD